MFDRYTSDQLIELRLFCSGIVERVSRGKSAYVGEGRDTLLLMEYIDEELAARARQKVA